MNRMLTIVLQVFGYMCLLAMITTIQVGRMGVFEPPILVRLTIGFIGIVLVLIGAFGMGRSK